MVLAPVPKFIGVCVRAGTMDKAIKVRTAKQKLDPFLKTHYKVWPTYIVHDPYNSCRTGDVVRFQQFPTGSRSKRIKHAVTEILAAFGPRLEDRPPVMSAEEQQEKLRAVEERQERRRNDKLEAKAAAALTRMSKRKKNLGDSPVRSQHTDIAEQAEARLEASQAEFQEHGVIRPVKSQSSEALSRNVKETRKYWAERRAQEISNVDTGKSDVQLLTESQPNSTRTEPPSVNL